MMVRRVACRGEILGDDRVVHRMQEIQGYALISHTR